MSLLPRPEIANLRIAAHGGPDYAELEALGLSPDDVIDFSVSSNPIGPPRGVRSAARHARIDRYPDSQAGELRHLLAEKLGVASEQILVGSGSTELIRLAALAYLDRYDKAMIIEPTFAEYEVACRIMGSAIIRQHLAEEDDFALDTDQSRRLMEQHRPRLVFICNPNNPTGKYVRKRDFVTLFSAAGDSLVVLDEAYVPFVSRAWSWRDMIDSGNLLVLRSMTKDYNLAGLRLGYAIARADIIEALRTVCPPWNVNSVAQQAGITALEQKDFAKRSRLMVARAKDYLVSELTRLGFRCLPSDANYFLVDVGNAADFRRRLLRQKLLVRDCASFGLPHLVRIAPRRMSHCRKLITAIRKLGPEGDEE
ncbi:MAG: histidinol-phosphate transaminase [Chloroflexi bacterium]|nr:histidinol-phosphate transaminase [Chloroflexota bacterium]